jgi:transposase
MEACCGAHRLGRIFAAHGHDVRLTSPELVRPYVKAHKSDDRDAEGIAEAATRPMMGFGRRRHISTRPRAFEVETPLETYQKHSPVAGETNAVTYSHRKR